LLARFLDVQIELQGGLFHRRYFLRPRLLQAHSRGDLYRPSLGRPAHNVKYRAELGRTWTYGVLGNPEHTQVKVFDVDFSADDKVLSFGERNEPEMN
jgi:hypothetical protein